MTPSEQATYEYSGHLKHLLYAPDPVARETVAQVVFEADDLLAWDTSDDPVEPEWQGIPVHCERSAEGVVLEGHFDDRRRIPGLGEDNPRYWVPLSGNAGRDDRFPIDLEQYPIAEITYRCRTAHARPAWALHYKGGAHFDGLRPTDDWRTIARLVPHFGFPEKLTGVSLRLFSTGLSTESVEVQSVRFRAMTPAEAEGISKHFVTLRKDMDVPRYPILQDFFPMGVHMNASSSKQLADLMEISFEDYWRLALDDIARHSHNCVVLEDTSALSEAQWSSVLAQANSSDIRILAMHEWDAKAFEGGVPEVVEKYVTPYADSPALLGWSISSEPTVDTFEGHLAARKCLHEADPAHPMAVMMSRPDNYPLYAPFFAASGLTFHKTHAPWELAGLVRHHLPLCNGQQFWLSAGTYVYATDAPEWKTCPEIRLMLNAAFACGVRGWFSYAYHNMPIWVSGNVQRTLTGPFLTFSDIWAELGRRMERFGAMTPLLLNAAPDGAPSLDIGVSYRSHPHSHRPASVPPVQRFWLQGPDYALLYLVSNDTQEMTPAYISVPDSFPGSLEVYDITDFVRTRSWGAMARERHLEMFPGQGQLLMVAEPRAAEHWRDQIIQRIISDDRRQVTTNLKLIEGYNLDVSEVRRLLELSNGERGLLRDLASMREAKDTLVNILYATPSITNPRSTLIQTSAALAGCDGALCRLIGAGKGDAARRLGEQVLPLSRDLNHLFLRLRAGEGNALCDDTEALSRNALKLLASIRGALTP